MNLQTHQRLNRAAWNQKYESYIEAAGENWQSNDPVWGIWQIPNDQTPLLPSNLDGKRCLEIGCGAGYVSSWMESRGGEVTGIDPSVNQLSTAQRLNALHGRKIEFIEGFGEALPFSDDSFDFAISEYGASLWADPYVWIPEASRVLRSGSKLTFMTCHPIAQLCAPDDEESSHEESLLRPYLGLHRLEWSDPDTIEFQLPHGKWIELLRANGFEIERLLELGSPDARATSRYRWANPVWAQSWPMEEVWFVRKL